MQEKKKRVVIASVLKPVNDTRMFGKIAHTLHATERYEVHVIGFPAPAGFNSPVNTHALPFFKRISFQRIIAPYKILRDIVKLKPALFIITTHELLGTSIWSKALTDCKVIYDVQENYFYNILHTGTFPYLLRPLVAGYVRLKELIFSKFVDHFFLAEKGYDHELTFIRKRKTIIENKVKRQQILREKKTGGKNLLFSGTLAETTGVFVAIELAAKLYAADADIRLTIIGYCAKSDELSKIKGAIEYRPFINLIGGSSLVPHEQIISAIIKADFGIISYPVNRATASSTPTKLYEYLGYQLPILLVNYLPWVEMCAAYHAAIVFDLKNIDVSRMLYEMQSEKFYIHSPSDVYWDSEESKLLGVIDGLF